MSTTDSEPVPTGAVVDGGSTREAADAALGRLARGKDAWVRLGIPERVKLLRECRRGVVDVADEWVRAAARAKGFDPGTPIAGEEWVTGPMTTVRNLRLFEEALAHGAAPPPKSITRGPGGRLIAKVFPMTALDWIEFSGMTVEVWLQAGQPATQGRLYRDKAAGLTRPGGIALVLGAGNIASIPPLDALHRLLVEDQVVALKMNPVNEYLAPLFARAFGPLIERGFLEVITGGPEVGDRLAQDPRVGALHLTGSSRTHDAIVWGTTAEEQTARRAAGTPRINKPFSSELGCVTPILVVPGHWSERDLDFQARHVASMVAHNGSFNCTAGKVLVLARGWEQRDQFIARVAQALAAAPARRAYYPGAMDRYRAFRDRYPQARPLGADGDGVVPWTLIPGVPPRRGEYALTEEAFCGILAEVTLDAADVPGYLLQAVQFANECVRGTLACVVLAHPVALRGREGLFEEALAQLRFGNIGVNAWTGVNFALGVASWGAYPGHTLADVGSGRGTVHNTFLFDFPEKSIVRAPFRIFPKPIWFADHRTLHKLGPRLVALENAPGWLRLLPVGLTALAG